MSSRLRTRLRAGTGLSTPSLNLEFQTAAGTLDPRITFSRGSQATLVDSTGKLTYAPNNLVLQSEAFDASPTWIRGNVTVTANAAVAPNGTTTADSIAFAAIANANIQQTVTVTSGATYIYSVYVRADSPVSNVKLSVPGQDVAISVGTSWTRVFMTVTATSSSLTLYILTRDAVASTIYAWGAQLEQVTYQTTPGTYNSTSPKNLLGYTQEFDNAAWTKSNAFVQTNLLTYSQDITNAAWLMLGSAGASRAADVAVAPDGTTTADRYTVGTGSGAWYIANYANYNIVSGQTYTFSFYVKANGLNYVFARAHNNTVALSQAGFIVSLIDGSITYPSSPTLPASTGTATNVGNGWWRITVTSTANATVTPSTGGPGIWPCNGTSFSTTGGVAPANFTGDGTSGVFLWGAQLVQGSTAGDYQRTDAAAAAVQYVAPDGSRTAELMNATAGSVSPLIFQNTAAVASSAVISFYAKAGTYGLVQISSEYGSGYYANFDLNNGVVGSRGASCTDSTITALGNGWYRISATLTAYDNADISLIGSTTATIRQAFTAAGTETVYIWGAQLSNSASLDPYVYNPVAAPTSAAYYGPRFDYDPVTLANKGLLIEEQRTNISTYSEQFDNAVWTKSASTVTANAIISPDGLVNSDKLIGTATTAEHYIEQSVSFTTGTTYTFSFYAKAGEISVISARSTSAWAADPRIRFTLTGSGTVTVDNGSPTGTITPVGNGWYRCTMTATTNATIGGVFRLSLYNGAYSYLGDGTSGAFIYGAQLEAGSFATSYIPTVASQVTRTADVALMQGANFSNWYNQNAGTWLAEWSPYAVTGSVVAQISAATNNDRFQILNDNSSQVGITTGGVGQGGVDAGTVNAGASNKLAFAYQTNDVPASLNGGAVVADTSVIIPVVDRLCIGATVAPAGFLNGHIRRIGYYPTRLANEQLQSLTAQSTIPSLSLDFTTQVFNVG